MKIDFLLIGGGIAGLSLGYRLKKAGKTVRIFDLRMKINPAELPQVYLIPLLGERWVKTLESRSAFPRNPPILSGTGATHWQEFSEYSENLPSLFIY